MSFSPEGINFLCNQIYVVISKYREDERPFWDLPVCL